MAWYNEESPETLNFVVVGNDYAGHSLLQASLAAHPNMACHGDLFNPAEKIRRKEHEEYFGDSGKVPDWYQPHTISIEQYLNNKIFDNTLFNEKAVGVRLNYSLFVKGDIWDYVDQKCRGGDFCLLHVTRNPVACFVEYMASSDNDDIVFMGKDRKFGSMMLDPRKLTNFVREHLANELKVNRLCNDKAIIPYSELILDNRKTLNKVFKFLEVPFSPACVPNIKRFSMQDTRNRIGNLRQLESELPGDVLDYLQTPNLF